MESSLTFVETLLGVNTHPNAGKLSKYQALQQLAQAMGQPCQPAPISVNFSQQANAVGVQQPACNDCGNCVSGCNIGAKNHLAMNAWPLAKSQGVEIYTGATVETLERINDSWQVHIRLTQQPEKCFTLTANRVILAAGTLGSSEILMRSQEQHRLTLSEQLGKRFSANGDALVFGYGQRQAVNAVAKTSSNSQHPEPVAHTVGPTITGHIRSEQQAIRTLEDGAIPYPLVRLWGEMITTQAMFKRWTATPSTAWQQNNPQTDPMTVSVELLDHCQTLLCMGQDEGDGELYLHQTQGRSYLLPRWHHPTATPGQDFYQQLHHQLKGLEKSGFDGGYYLPAPQWKFFPEEGENIAAGVDQAGGLLASVHPLGGCAMAEDASLGVVNNRGQVYCSHHGSAVYHNLYVLDGAIIPGPLGINPLLTISALAHHLATLMVDGTIPQSLPQVSPELATPPLKQGFTVANPEDDMVDVVFRERPFGSLHGSGSEVIAETLGGPYKQALLSPNGMVVAMKIDIPDFFRWLSNPSTDLAATYTLHANTQSDAQQVTIPDNQLSPPLVTIPNGTVRMLNLSKPAGILQRCYWTVFAMWQFFRLRGDEIVRGIQSELFPSAAQKRRRTGKQRKGLFARLKDMLKRVTDFVRLATTFADHRTLDYHFEHSLPDGQRLSFSGQKVMAYSHKHRNVWDALIHLPFKLTLNNRHSAHGELKVDLIRMAKGFAPYQVTRSPDTPTTLMAMAGMAALSSRCLMQTHFWSFGAPNYPELPSKSVANQDRLAVPPQQVEYWVGQQRYHAPQSDSRQYRPNAGQAAIRLIRYQPQHLPQALASLLLIHGGAHSSRVFWTDSIDTNLLQHLLGQGYDVWLLDHRFSSSLSGVVEQDISLDHLADEDIPWAVTHIYQTIKQKLHVFAHCIGGGAFTMSALKGKLKIPAGQLNYNPPTENNQPDLDMVASVALHAVMPWLVTSEPNRLRSYALSAVRENLPLTRLDPIPHNRPEFIDTLLDRIASSLHWSSHERGLHKQHDEGDMFARTVCNRMTLFYAKLWRHVNLSKATHTQMRELVGPAGLALYKHMYYCTLRGVLTDNKGQQVYLTQDNLQHNWPFPTLMLHGDKNLEFDIQSSRLSAFMLAHIRATHQQIPGRVDDYSSQNVWLKQIKGIGHLDMLFGKDGVAATGKYDKSFSAISGFFDHTTAIDRGQPPFRSDQTLPFVQTQGKPQPQTGPIISRPRVENNRLKIRVWLETSQMSPRKTTQLIFTDAAGQRYQINRNEQQSDSSANIQLLRPTNPQQDQDPMGQSRFWLFDLLLPLPSDSHPVFPLSLRLVTDLSLPSDKHPPGTLIDWQDCDWLTRLQQPTQNLSLLAGSCLYPGSPFEREIGDQIFASMQQQADIDFLLLLGDQIYADATAELFDPYVLEERFRKRYHQAFGSPGKDLGQSAQRLFSQLPCYFTLDDHELRDNWQGPHKTRDHELFRIARSEAWNYQMHHDQVTGQEPTAFWYHFEQQGFPVFVFDTRTERDSSQPASEVGALIQDTQLQGFEHWLSQQQTVIQQQQPLIIATGSTLGPVAEEFSRYPQLAAQTDSLLAYPGFIQGIYQLLKKYQVNNIIWLAGDKHLSCVADICINQDNQLRILHIVASGLFAPLPFVNDRADRYHWQQTPTTLRYASPKLSVSSKADLLTTDPGHFVRIDITPAPPGHWQLTVSAINRNNQLLSTQIFKL